MKFDFKEKYILENEIVRLQPLENTDFDVLLEFSENEPEIWDFNSNGANGKENLEKYIANATLSISIFSNANSNSKYLQFLFIPFP